MTIRDRLRMLIASVSMGNIAAFSRETGVKDSTIRAWFAKPEANLTIDNLEKICLATGVSADWLIFGSGQMVVRNPRSETARRRIGTARGTADFRDVPGGGIAELASLFDERAPREEDRLARFVSRGSPEISDEFRAQAAKELNRLLQNRRKKL